MRVSDVLRDKGGEVVTVTPRTTVHDLVALLARRRIGATVVSADGVGVAGIVSERDVVRALAERGDGVLAAPVEQIMTSGARVHTCAPTAGLDDLVRLMTEQRIRHVPVVVDGALQGIVSIGDVVKIRMRELESERASLADYISSAG